jgi:hypothetical protein
MADTPTDPRERFLNRIERRTRFLTTLKDCGLGLYLPAEEQKRKHAIDQLARMTARQSELPHLDAATLAEAAAILTTHIEAMQALLPHDVQYRSRIRRASW